MIGGLKPTGQGAELQFSGWIIQQAQQKFKNKLYAVIGTA